MKAQATTADALRLLMQGSSALSRMESAGIRIDIDYLDSAIKGTEKKIEELERSLQAGKEWKVWKKVHGDKAKLGSREQLADVLFKRLKIPYVGERTPTGRHKADESVFADIDLPFVKDYVRWAKYGKAKSTYLEGIRSEVVDGFLHCNFNLHTVITYRSSSSLINFQNMPVRDVEIGELIRRCFIPRKGRVLVEIDYGGIEVRGAAWYHQDPTMLAYIADPSKDMHRDMAMECYLLTLEEVDKRSRYAAKNLFVFPQFYGDYYIHCAKNLWEAISRLKLATPSGMPLREHLAAKGIKELGACDPYRRPLSGTFERHLYDVEQRFWSKRFPVYRDWKEKWWQTYRKTGRFDMLTGFRVEGLFGKNDVVNYPVQGVAFHCLLWSLVNIQQEIDKRRMRTKLVGQIHDSGLADVPVSEVQDYLCLAKEIMTEKIRKVWKWIITDLVVEADVTPDGESWTRKSEWTEKSGKWAPKGKAA
jgi:DNA polymerase-1